MEVLLSMPIKECTLIINDEDFEDLNDFYFNSLLGFGCLKILGETEPKLSELSIILKKEEKIFETFIYEYIWSLAILPPIGYNKDINWVDELENVLVQIYFDTKDTGYSVRVLSGTLKPFLMTKKSYSDALCDFGLKYGATVTKGIGGFISSGQIEKVGEIMDMLANVEKDVVPSSHAYPWYLKSIVARDIDNGPLYGIEWTIGRNAFFNIGNCLTGGMEMIFIQSSNMEKKKSINFDIRAQLKFKENRELWIPEDPLKSEFIRKRSSFEIVPKC
jgi:hypothetical protein